MKHLNRMFSLLLALVMVLSLLPLAAFAEESGAGENSEAEVVPMPTFKVNVSAVCYTKTDMKTLVGTASTLSLEQTEAVTLDEETFGPFLSYKNKLYEFRGIFFEGSLHDSVTVNYAVDLKAVYTPHTHRYLQRYNRAYHWMGCRCGSVIQKAKHVDPATDSDSICTCGYEFSHNADLVTLWLRNMQLSPRFNRNTTEYTGEIFTYKDVTSTKISYKALDSLATVEVSGGTEIHDGLNVFEITVTAEDRKTTKTYTVFAAKPVKVDGVTIYNDGSTDGGRTTEAAPKATLKRTTASLSISEAVAKKLAEQAATNESTHINVEPKFSKWSTKVFTVSFPAAALTAISENCDADLVIKTFMADVTIPNEVLADLAKEGNTITLRLDKEPSVALSITADEKEVAVSDKIAVDVK